MLQRTEPRSEFSRPAPVLAAAAVQMAAAALAYGLLRLAATDTGGAALWPWVAGLLAAVLSAALRLPWWWIPINFALLPAAGMLLASGLPAIVYLAVFVGLWLANPSAWRARVPLYLSSGAAVAAMLQELPAHSRFRMIDAGCGTGSMLMPLARARSNGTYHGVEFAPLPFLASWLRTRCMRHGPRIAWGDLWKRDLSGYDVVYVYLSPAAMPRLWHKACREMRPGTLLISNCFTVPGIAPLRVVPYAAHRELYVWRMQ